MASPVNRGAEEGRGGASLPATPQFQEWQRAGYPDEATFNRIVEEYPEIAYNSEANAFVSFHGLPPWLRLGWPSPELWARAKGTRAARMRWAEMQKLYPDREGVRPDEQDLMRMMRYWPDCFGQPFVEVEITLTKDIITINDLHYSRGLHRVPKAVAVDLRRIGHESVQERLNALIGRTHAEGILATLSGNGSGVTGTIS